MLKPSLLLLGGSAGLPWSSRSQEPLPTISSPTLVTSQSPKWQHKVEVRLKKKKKNCFSTLLTCTKAGSQPSPNTAFQHPFICAKRKPEGHLTRPLAPSASIQSTQWVLGDFFCVFFFPTLPPWPRQSPFLLRLPEGQNPSYIVRLISTAT